MLIFQGDFIKKLFWLSSIVLGHRFLNSEGITRLFVSPCGQLPKVPITTLSVFALKVSQNERDSDFIFGVCCFFSGTRWNQGKFTDTCQPSSSSSGPANLTRLPERQMEWAAAKGLGFYSNMTSFTHNGASESCLFQDLFTGKSLLHQASFLTVMGFLLYSPWT